MKQYWPMAVAMDYEHNPYKPLQLFTYDSCLSIEKCGEVFKSWQNDCNYTLLCTWIDVTDGESKKLINHRCWVNAIGQVKKI